MVNSMTAFSKNESHYNWGCICWEIRSLNQRYLDIHIDLPKNLNELSWIIRKKIQNHFVRGKIECNLQLDIYNNSNNQITLNKNLIHTLITSAQWIKKQINEGEIEPLGILNYPGVISHKLHNTNNIDNELLTSFEHTLNQLKQHREKEGSFLKEKITERLNYISDNINSIQQYMPNIIHQKRKKLLEYVQNSCIEFDSSRLEQELLIIIQKIDITEELERLIFHVKEMSYFLLQTGSIGRRLDFIAQELQRESNTLTAKSTDTNLTQLAISLKVLIEQIREQIQNIE